MPLGVWNPVEYGLDSDFHLTHFADEKLLGYLKDIGNDIKPNEIPGMDCSMVMTRIPGYYSIATTDFFFPLVDDPYLQGRIACCNVLSDLYAMGVIEVDTMLMALGVCTTMTQPQRDVVTREMIRGFNDTAREAETNVTGGQTIMNKWALIGGVATALGKEDVDFIRPVHGVAGDVVVLTKPLGTQVAVNAYDWMHKGTWSKAKNVVTVQEGVEAYVTACECMSRLNRNAARMLHKYHAHASTDVTGFGIVGHGTNLAEAQEAKVDIRLHTLPLIRHTRAINGANDFKLMIGRSAETSGGLLVLLPAAQAEGFIRELSVLDNAPAWIIGDVVEGNGQCSIVADPTIVEV